MFLVIIMMYCCFAEIRLTLERKIPIYEAASRWYLDTCILQSTRVSNELCEHVNNSQIFW